MNQNLKHHIKFIFIRSMRKISSNKKIASLFIFLHVFEAFIINEYEKSFYGSFLESLSIIPTISMTLLCLFINNILFFLLGNPLLNHQLYKALSHAGIKTHTGEIPILVEKNTNEIVLWTSGIHLNEFIDKKNDLEASLNILIDEIHYEKNQHFIVLEYVNFTKYEGKINWEKKYLDTRKSILTIGIGLSSLIQIDLSKTPHILMGGATGSGKTILLKNMLNQMIIKNYVVFLCDFKGGVDFSNKWNDHIQIITEIDKMNDILTNVINEMDKRKELFNSYDFENIDTYNKGCRKYNLKLKKRIAIAVDEIAELLDKTGLSKDEKNEIAKIEKKLSSIARLGRAFGIHLFVGTQRPDANILQGQIKNNLNYRICGYADDVLSMIILDNTMASREIKSYEQGKFVQQEGKIFQGFYFDDSMLDNLNY